MNRFQSMATRAGKRRSKSIAPESSCWAMILPRLTADQQDLRLEGVQETHFFLLLRAHTVEGMFCDPLHGGNIGHGRLEADWFSRTTDELSL